MRAQRRQPHVHGTPAAQPPEAFVRYWAAARAAAGRELDQVPAGTLDQVLRAVRALHPGPDFERVLAVCSVLVGPDPVGDRSPEDVEVPPGSVVEVLPPFAGG